MVAPETGTEDEADADADGAAEPAATAQDDGGTDRTSDGASAGTEGTTGGDASATGTDATTGATGADLAAWSAPSPEGEVLVEAAGRAGEVTGLHTIPATVDVVGTHPAVLQVMTDLQTGTERYYLLGDLTLTRQETADASGRPPVTTAGDVELAVQVSAFVLTGEGGRAADPGADGSAATGSTTDDVTADAPATAPAPLPGTGGADNPFDTGVGAPVS